MTIRSYLFLSILVWPDVITVLPVDDARPEIHILSDGFQTLSDTPSLRQATPVFTVGIDHLVVTYPQFRWTWQPITSPVVVDCASLTDNVQFLLARWYYSQQLANTSNTAVIISAGCWDSMALNLLAAAWDVLLITGMDYKDGMQNRRLYPTFLTTADGTPPLGVLNCLLFQKMNWTKLYMLFEYSSSSEYYGFQNLFIVANMQQACPRAGIQVTRNRFSVSAPEAAITSLLQDFNNRSRVLLYFGNSPGLRRIIVAAERLNMTNGAHVYSAVRPYDSDLFGPRGGWQPWPTDDETIHNAYRSVLLMSLSDEVRYATPAMTGFIQKWKNFFGPDDTPVRNNVPFLVSLHTALELAGIAINETFTPDRRRHGGLPPSGTTMASGLLNRTFQLAMGQVHMMAAAQISRHHFIALYDVGLRQYKTILRSSSNDLTDLYDWFDLTTDGWFGGSKFPADEPICGFDGNAKRCQFSSHERSLGIAFGSLFILCLMAALIRKVRQVLLLNSIWWIVTAKEIKSRRITAFPRRVI